MTKDQFIDIPFTVNTLDTYVIRTAIWQALTDNLPKLQGVLLDVGCGKMPYREFILGNSLVTDYVGLDIEGALIYDGNIKPDYTWDGITMPFKNREFDCAIGTELLEHCPDPEMLLSEIYRVLDSQGVFFFTVPFLWNLHEVPNDEYRYTPFALQRHLKNSGFREISIEATGGWHAAMAQMLGLWVRRAPISARWRKYLSMILRPFMRLLLNMDGGMTIEFKEGQMITGLSGVAIK